MSLEIVRGDIWTTDRRFIAVPVNCYGVMGRGLAQQCQDRYPETLRKLRRLKLEPGQIAPLYYTGTHWILAAATKDHWRNPSQMEWVRSCLRGIAQLNNVALPLLGAGLGGLSGEAVLNAARMYLNMNRNEYTLYLPPEG